MFIFAIAIITVIITIAVIIITINITTIIIITTTIITMTVSPPSLLPLPLSPSSSPYHLRDCLCAAICGLGQYLNETAKTCLNCSLGTYNPVAGTNTATVTECLQCPDGFTTSMTGTDNVNSCSVGESVYTDGTALQKHAI